MMATPRDVIDRHYAASARGDLDGMTADFAADIEWTEMAGFPYAGTYRGPEAVRQGVFLRIAADWDGYQAVPAELVDSGEHVVAFGVYSGTYRRTGRRMEAAAFVHHWQVRDGAVVRFEQYTDTHLVRQAMR
jgi:ketosteroid isomerase-like protein